MPQFFSSNRKVQIALGIILQFNIMQKLPTSVYTTVLCDPASGFVYPRAFKFILRFVIVGHLDGLAIAADHTTAVTSIGNIQLSSHQEGYHCCTP